MAVVVGWTVGDFKSLESASVLRRFLTTLTGANSSGKSSVLQAMLMVAQSVNSRSGIVLNGPLVRLGTPGDVIRNGQHSIRFTFDVDVGDPALNVGPTSLTLRVSLVPDKSGDRLEPASIEIVERKTQALLFAATAERRNSADEEYLRKQVAGDSTPLRVTWIEGRRAHSRIYVSMLGLIPVALAIHRSSDLLTRQFVSLMSTMDLRSRIPYEIGMELARLVKRSDIAELPPRESINKSARFTAREIATLDQATIERFIELASVRRGRKEWVVVQPEGIRHGLLAGTVPSNFINEGLIESAAAIEFEGGLSLLSSVGAAVSQFGTAVRYLGPLREEPRVVHGAWDESISALPVGIRGELTAEVLTRRKTDVVSYTNPEGGRQDHELPKAVATWCAYFGIGDDIEVLDLGKLGRGVHIRVNGTYRDLTTVGVGASQLLPVIVAGLASPPRSVVLVEQPELHLHPLVQSRLADFFLSARPDVRWIIETHSEYLITRLRRRVAEGAIDPNRIQVLFAEQSDGVTDVRRLDMSELGDFESWPHGFFDAQDMDSLKIVTAIAKRVRGSSDIENTP